MLEYFIILFNKLLSFLQSIIWNYPGYIQTSDADIALLATDAENISIRNQMNAGFFYE